ncbi:MAG: aminoacyl-tRNA hydrolase [Erysipelotrichaceae bacterium]
MKLIVGLGNPGKEYERTRHNAGFMVLDALAGAWNLNISTKKFKGLLAETNIKGQKVILLKPQTYMNLSGESVRAVADFYNLEEEDILIIYDDLDLPVGKLRLREKGSAGGQNGVKSIIAHLGTQTFPRIRVGIGKDPRIPTVDYVLGKFREDEKADFKTACEEACKAAEAWVSQDFSVVMNNFNKK